MRAVGIGIADALEDREVPRLPGFHQRRELFVQAHLLVELQGALARHADAAAQRMIVRVGIGDEGVQPVIAALELDQQQDAAPRLIGEGRTAGQHHTEGAGAEEEIATVHGRPHFNW